jgi:4-amino-4-deoxy-L-arabinose transferase-like glycosyltransferase
MFMQKIEIKLLDKHQMLMTMLVIGILSIYAVIGVFKATPDGPPFGSDSVTYMTTAFNFSEGRGFGYVSPESGFELLTFYPPLYPAVLSLFAFAGLDILTTAHWINALVFGLLVFLMGWGIWKSLHSPLGAGLLAALLAFSAVMIELHVWVMSDALCLVLGMGGLLALLDYMNSNAKKYVLVSAVLTGLAFLTRYAGVAYCVTGFIGVFLFTPSGLKKRILAGLSYALVSLAPMLIWLGIEWIVSNGIASRTLLPPDTLLVDAMVVFRSLKEFAYLWLPSIMTISQTLGQQAFRMIYLGLALIIIGAYMFTIFQKRRNLSENWFRTSGLTIFSLFFIFMVIYLIVIIVSYSLIYPPPYLVDRMFAPIQVGLLVIISTMLGVIFKTYKHLLVRLLTVTLSLLLVLDFWGAARTEIDRLVQNPPGYLIYQNSALIDYVTGLPKDTPIISNKTSVIQYFVGRPAYAIQELYSLTGVDEFTKFGDDRTDPAQTVFRDRGGALVLFGSLGDEFTAMYGEQGDERYAAFVDGLFLAYDLPEGRVYFFESPSP